MSNQAAHGQGVAKYPQGDVFYGQWHEGEVVDGTRTFADLPGMGDCSADDAQAQLTQLSRQGITIGHAVDLPVLEAHLTDQFGNVPGLDVLAVPNTIAIIKQEMHRALMSSANAMFARAVL